MPFFKDTVNGSNVGVIEAIGTNSPCKPLFEGRPFASADADRILVKHTGKDLVEFGWITSRVKSWSWKVWYAHSYKSICCTIWSSLAITLRPRFMIWLQAIDIEAMTFPWRTLDAQEFHRLQKQTSSFPPHCHMTLVTKGMLVESNSLYSWSGWCMGRHSFSSWFFFDLSDK